jgi:phosphomannomutase
MVKHCADYGGELSGHTLLKDNNYCELPLLVMLAILKIVARSASSGQAGKDIGQLVEQFKTWFNSGEISVEFENPRKHFEELAPLLKKKYADGKCKELDGLTIEYPDWWFNVRPSNTESLLRIIVEAKTPDLLKEKTDELRKLAAAVGRI